MKTENSYLADKIQMREAFLIDNKNKKEINILDCFSADFKIWGHLKKKYKNIKITRLDKEDSWSGFYLQGDNIKFLPKMDLSKYDIIDLDAYGIPYQQLEIIFSKKYSGRIYVTAIQTMYGSLPKQMLEKIGFSQQMLEKIPSLFNKNGIKKILQYLAGKGVKEIKIRSDGRKNYFYFDL